MKKAFEKVKADNRIIIGYSASLFLLLVVYVATLVANSKLKEKTRLVEHTYQVKFNLEALISKIKDAETGVRGFAITRNSDYLEPYNHSREAVDSLYNILWNLTNDNVVQRMHLAELQDAYLKRFGGFEKYLTYINNGEADTTYNLTQQRLASKRAMNSIRRIVGGMQQEETTLLEERDQNQKTWFSSINTITIISLLLTLVLVIIGFVTYTSENKARREGLQKIRAYQEELRKRIEELNTANTQLIKMRSTEKFAATGRIARTIAHEVRNPLTNIDLAVSQLRADIGEEDKNTQYLFDVIDRNSARINKLISDLLQTTKFSDLRFSRLPINTVIDDTLILAKDRLELNQVQVEKNYKEEVAVNMDADKIKIAFLNIIINAVEAMEPGKGKLKITAEREDGNCAVTITDNGSGMDETSLSKLFEPYFSNKINGNGLGLANTQNIIFNHKGSINVKSKPGEGSSFTILLPVG